MCILVRAGWCVCVCVCVCACVCVWSGCARVGAWGLGGVVLLVGNNVMRLFSFLYTAAPHMAHGHYYVSCILSVVIFLCVTLLSMLPLILFSLDFENVRECCKVDQRIALY